MKNCIAIAALAALAGAASADLVVTEVYGGVGGPDGTRDWFEVTNVGGAPIDTADYRYDDSSADLLESVQLPSLIVNPGESAVILTRPDAQNDLAFTDAVGEFLGIWGAGINVGALAIEGAGLGQPDDEVNLFLAGAVVSSLAYTQGGSLITTESDVDGVRLSVLGENGAFESATFTNDFLDAPLIGSPGVSTIPAPTALAAFGAVALAGARRRR